MFIFYSWGVFVGWGTLRPLWWCGVDPVAVFHVFIIGEYWRKVKNIKKIKKIILYCNIRKKVII